MSSTVLNLLPITSTLLFVIAAAHTIASRSLLRATCKPPAVTPATPSRTKKRKLNKGNANNNVSKLKGSVLVSFPLLF